MGKLSISNHSNRRARGHSLAACRRGHIRVEDRSATFLRAVFGSSYGDFHRYGSFQQGHRHDRAGRPMTSPNPPSTSLIDVSTVDTREPARDNDLRSDKFFDVAHFPTMTFKSKKVAQLAPGKLKVTGDLTIRGTTKEVVLDVEGPTAPLKDSVGQSTSRGKRPRQKSTARLRVNGMPPWTTAVWSSA